MSEKDYLEKRRAMIDTIGAHASACGGRTGRPAISDAVTEAMLEVPRHRFVPESLRAFAYADQPLPIGHDKTISQPFIVALMVDLLDLQPHDRVLEIGTGLGYQSAVLSRLARDVYTVDIIAELASEAAEIFSDLQYSNIHVRIANGQYGWVDHAQYDKIIVAASADLVPQPLYDQLAVGGRLVMPVGPDDAQSLVLATKSESGIDTSDVLAVRFLRMVVAH